MVVIWRVWRNQFRCQLNTKQKGQGKQCTYFKRPLSTYEILRLTPSPTNYFQKKIYCPYFAAWYSVVSAVISEQKIYPPKIIPFPTHPPPKFENTFIAAEKNLHAIAAFTKNKLHLIKVMKIPPLCLVHGLKHPATNLSNCTYSGRFRQKKILYENAKPPTIQHPTPPQKLLLSQECMKQVIPLRQES